MPRFETTIHFFATVETAKGRFDDRSGGCATSHLAVFLTIFLGFSERCVKVASQIARFFCGVKD